MSRVGPDLFVAAHHVAVRSPVTLASIAFSVPSATTLYVATDETTTPDGTLWVAGLECDEIDDSIDLYGPGPSPVFATFHLAPRFYSALGATALDSTRSLLWKGAVVNLWIWERSLVDIADRMPQFVNGVVDTATVRADGKLEVTVMQSRTFNVDFPQRMVDRVNDPFAPEMGSTKVVRPALYGDHRSLELRAPNPSGLSDEHEDMGGARAVVPLVMTDTGAGANDVKLLAADHQLGDLIGTRARIFLPTAHDTLAPVVIGGGVTEVLGATFPDESYVTIADESLIVKYSVPPIDVSVTAAAILNTALNPRRAIDLRDETTYATLDQALGYSKLCLLLPNPPKFGEINGGVQVTILFSGDAGNGNDLRLYVQDSSGLTPTLIGYSSTSPTIAKISFSITSTWYGGIGWEFGLDNGGMTYAGHAIGRTVALVVDFAGGATNKAKIYGAALEFNVAPNRNIVVEGKPRTIAIRDPQKRGATWNLHKRLVEVPEVREVANFDAPFYATLLGPADDGSGTVTGTAGATIERPADIARHILTEVAGVDPADLQTAAGAVGSFVDARDKFREDTGTDFKLAAYFGQKGKVQDALQAIANQSMGAFWVDPLTGLWCADAWRVGEGVQYPDVLGRAYGTSECDIFDLEVEEQSIVDQRTGVRVGFCFDHFKGRTLFETFVTPDGSSRGFNHPDARDQRIVIDGTNDKLDWKTGAWGGGPFTWADTLTHATYAAGIDAAADIQAKMRARIAAYYTYVGHGFSIRAGHNDSLEFGYGASTYATSIPEGDYSADGLAYVVARLMNLVAGLDGVLAVTYSQTTNKFSVTSAGSNWNPVPIVTAVNPGSLCWPTLGQVANRAGATAHTFTYARYGETFWACSESTATFQFLFGTGANVATSCSLAFGWEASDTTLGNNTSAEYARGTREALADQWRDAYQFSQEETIQADMIRDEATAVRVRNRRLDSLLRPPILVRFKTHRAVDLQKMQTFELSSDVDALRPFPRYGSDGSWSGKVLKCIGVTRGMGPSYLRQVRAVEVRPDR